MAKSEFRGMFKDAEGYFRNIKTSKLVKPTQELYPDPAKLASARVIFKYEHKK